MQAVTPSHFFRTRRLVVAGADLQGMLSQRAGLEALVGRLRWLRESIVSERMGERDPCLVLEVGHQTALCSCS
jgi:hypothetical protein